NVRWISRRRIASCRQPDEDAARRERCTNEDVHPMKVLPSRKSSRVENVKSWNLCGEHLFRSETVGETATRSVGVCLGSQAAMSVCQSFSLCCKSCCYVC